MALRTDDESKLAIIYHQPYPNTALNSTASRMTMRVFQTSDGTNLASTSYDYDREGESYFGKYSDNNDLIFRFDGRIMFNPHARSSAGVYSMHMMVFWDTTTSSTYYD